MGQNPRAKLYRYAAQFRGDIEQSFEGPKWPIAAATLALDLATL